MPGRRGSKSTGGGGLAWASSRDECEGNRASGCSSLTSSLWPSSSSQEAVQLA